MNIMAKRAKNPRAHADRAVKDMQSDFGKRIDEIRSELKEKGPEAIEAAEKSLGELKAGFEERLTDMREAFDDARESFDDAIETGRTAIQERPLMAVGIALATGVVIGMLLGQRGRGRGTVED